jgi:hypothetical protein
MKLKDREKVGKEKRAIEGLERRYKDMRGDCGGGQ